MREILFRGKRIDNGVLIVGQLLRYEDGRARICESHTDIFCYENDQSIIQTIAHEVCPDTVGQFTGLTDKNGKKIFEGDIVLYKIPDGSYAYGIVKFRETNEVGFCVEWFNRHDSGWLRNDIGFWAKYREIEVIGNIHDNPELLGGAEDG